MRTGYLVTALFGPSVFFGAAVLPLLIPVVVAWAFSFVERHLLFSSFLMLPWAFLWLAVLALPLVQQFALALAFALTRQSALTLLLEFLQLFFLCLFFNQRPRK